MFSKIWLFNIVLTALILSIGIRTAETWKQTGPIDDGFNVSAEEAKPKINEINLEKVEPAPVYEMIVENSLFSENRTEYIPEKTENEPEPLINNQNAESRPVFLYGVVMAGDYRKALIREITEGTGDDRWVREGDDINGMSVEAIEKDTLVLSSKDKKEKILLHEPSKPKKRIQLKRESKPTVISSKPRSLGPSMQEDKTDPSVEVERNVLESNTEKTSLRDKSSMAPVPVPTEDQKAPGETDSGLPEAQAPTHRVQNPLTELFQMPSDKSPKGEAQYEIIQSPFGEIKRKIN